jgi:hypothetical protein
MPWKCVMVDAPEEWEEFLALPAGAMWYLQPDEAERRRYEGALSHSYVRDHAGIRLPLVVKLPGRENGRSWCVDERAYDHARGGWYGEGWKVSGEPPNITCAPSINMPGDYHGTLTNGVLSDSSDPATRADLFLSTA